MLINLISNKSKPYAPPSWGLGTDAEIVEALQKHYAGEIDLTEHWKVGDARRVHLPEIQKRSGFSDKQPEQDVTLVIMNVGGKNFTSDDTECAFIVGQLEVMSVGGEARLSTEDEYWRNWSRRTWCNEDYYNAIPSTLRPIFRQFKNMRMVVPVAQSDDDYFAFPAEMEVFGRCTNSANYNFEQAYLEQFAYYADDTHKIKKTMSGTKSMWWLRSPSSSTSVEPCACSSSGASTFSSYSNKLGLAPFGCI